MGCSAVQLRRIAAVHEARGSQDHFEARRDAKQTSPSPHLAKDSSSFVHVAQGFEPISPGPHVATGLLNQVAGATHSPASASAAPGATGGRSWADAGGKAGVSELSEPLVPKLRMSKRKNFSFV
jgi:hypothetical protein